MDFDNIDFRNLTTTKKLAIARALHWYPKNGRKNAVALERHNAIIDALTKEYPFLKPRNRWTGKVQYSKFDDGTKWCEVQAMPDGWFDAFGIDMLNDLKDALLQIGKKALKSYRIMQIKEKYGELRWYANIEHGPVADIVYKYELLSHYTCITCGKKATQVTHGWYSPYCDKCIERMKHEGDRLIETTPVDEFFGQQGGDTFNFSYSSMTNHTDEWEPEVPGNASVRTQNKWNWEKSCWEFYRREIISEKAETDRKMILESILAKVKGDKELVDLVDKLRV